MSFSVDQFPIPSFTDELQILLIEDDRAFADLAETRLRNKLPDARIIVRTDPEAGLELVSSDDIHCVVSDYDMPTLDGIELLKQVRNDHSMLPFILFTGKGSEEVADEAISEGVSDYLQKGGTSDVFEILANRIQNHIDKYQTEQRLKQCFQALESTQEGIGVISSEGTYLYLNEAYASIYGRSKEDLIGRHWEELYPDEEVERFHDDILPELKDCGHWSGTAVGKRSDGSSISESLVLTHLEDGAHICSVQRQTDQ
ncbi:response regulator [Halostella pelagica]|uniref:response regulator n=1 Tax=Halostella pelagica TaxID=2583824 RepID=UPI001081466B|nr:response regulator [Halostella pelagica]